MLSVYIAATVFGAGITLLDMLGLIGQDSQDADGDGSADDTAGDDDVGLLEGHGLEGDEPGGEESGGSTHDADSEGNGDIVVGDAAATTDAADTGDDTGDDGSVAGHDRFPAKGNGVLRLLSSIRTSIYFCLGFGPVGWFALATGQSLVASLAWSIPVGGVVAIGARLLRRILRSELSSEVKDSTLLMEPGEVTVTIPQGQMGRVRISIGTSYVDRYARSKDPKQTLKVGQRVRVVDFDDECVFVEIE